MPNFSGIWNLKEQLQGIAAGRWTGIPQYELYSWGRSYNGVLGLNDVASRSSPTQIGSSSDWTPKAYAGAFNGAAFKNDGSLFIWGRGAYNGGTGLGDTTNKSSPVQLGASSDWSSVSVGDQFSVALTPAGELYAWGDNLRGQLGNSSIDDKSSPVQVGALTNWEKISAGFEHAGAIKTDGTLWMWGDNESGQVGDGTTTRRSSPVQIGADTDWLELSGGDSFMLAIKTSGALYAWGLNNRGQLGLGDASQFGFANRNSPVQVGALTNWAQAKAGDNNSVAVKTDGTLWSWGENGNGILGLNDIISRSSPVQVGALTNWDGTSSLKFGTNTLTVAVKTDGTLWSWGQNSNGELGHGDTVLRSSPTQIGSLTTWTTVAVGARFALGVTESVTS